MIWKLNIEVVGETQEDVILDVHGLLFRFLNSHHNGSYSTSSVHASTVGNWEKIEDKDNPGFKNEIP